MPLWCFLIFLTVPQLFVGLCLHSVNNRNEPLIGGEAESSSPAQIIKLPEESTQNFNGATSRLEGESRILDRVLRIGKNLDFFCL